MNCPRGCTCPSCTTLRDASGALALALTAMLALLVALPRLAPTPTAATPTAATESP